MPNARVRGVLSAIRTPWMLASRFGSDTKKVSKAGQIVLKFATWVKTVKKPTPYPHEFKLGHKKITPTTYEYKL